MPKGIGYKMGEAGKKAGKKVSKKAPPGASKGTAKERFVKSRQGSKGK